MTAQTFLLNEQETAVKFRAQRMLASVQMIKALGGESILYAPKTS
jgi:outer membrane protein TolC